jgi:putative nucleotidyltransferase with HDIG domain
VESEKRAKTDFTQAGSGNRWLDIAMDNLGKDTPVSSESAAEQVAAGRHLAARVLVVDDEPAARKLLCLILEPDYSCTAASNGAEALAALQREQFDAVISDLQMPGMSGLELLVKVRRERPYVAFLVTTGVDDVDIGVQAMRSGADDYLVKPLLGNAVLASLERALDKRRLEQQVENYRQHLEEMVVERTRQLRATLQQIERSYEDTLRALGAAIDLRDSETEGHSQRVCRYSIEIAKAMGWSEEQLENLARGAYLHDIGKLGIPDGILLKPGPLTPDERATMQTHVQIGFELVKGIPFLSAAADIVLMHHERHDGSGYPRGLKGDEILPGARIFAIADSFDAITSDRPYRRASPLEFGYETIQRASGGLFDAQVVNAFLSIPAEAWSRSHHPKTSSHDRLPETP